MKKIIGIGLILILLAVCLSGCIDNRDSRFIGTWKAHEHTISFHSDGTCSYFGISGKWDIKNDKLVLEAQDGGSIVYHYYFSEDNKVLYIKTTGADEYTSYIKQ
jgi:hypothetical protein